MGNPMGGIWMGGRDWYCPGSATARNHSERNRLRRFQNRRNWRVLFCPIRPVGMREVSGGQAMTRKLVAEIRFSQEVREFWPEKVLTAVAHLTDDNEKAGPWSMRAELWSPPDRRGIALSWISFLSPDAPFTALPLNMPFELTLGRTTIARCIISVQPGCGLPYHENDFVNHPKSPIRNAA